jgi:hypothetical protein
MNVTDFKAHVDAILSLERMICSWLKESFPKMPLEEMQTAGWNYGLFIIRGEKRA